jgi:3-deoxy-D-manno-octulosonate 8-phosphate phosphatase (KDO 8-P phosphatase)
MSNLLEKASRVQILVMDVDGVLTDGRLLFTADGHEIKSFHAHDGLGLKMLRDAQIQLGIISGRSSISVQMRAEQLGVSYVMQGIHDKGKALDELLKKAGCVQEQCAYIGDDLIDLPAFRKAGLSIAVANAVEDVRTVADYVTVSLGGCGAVRECAELLLKAQNKWQATLARYV